MSAAAFARGVALASLTVFAACDSPLVDAPGNTCVDDRECGVFAACVLGICIDPRAQRLDEVDLEIRPPEGSGLRPQQMFGVRVGPSSDEARAPILLRRTITLRGNVVDAADAPVTAQVVAVPQAGIPGRALVASASSSGPVGGFSLPLVAADPERGDEGYRLAVFPTESHARPPLYLEGPLRLEGAAAGEELGVIELPEPASLRTASGKVITSDGSAALPVPGLEVIALDEGRRVSSIGLTDELGSFTLFLSPQAPDAPQLEVRPTEASRLNPILTLAGFELGPDLVIDLGRLAAPVPFSGVVRGPTGAPVPGARIYARSESVHPGGTALLSVLTVADEVGAYDAELRPGRYAFAVVPPPAEPVAGLLTGFEANVGASAQPQFDLPGRIDLFGRVRSAEGQPVAGAEVRLSRIGPAAGGRERVLEGVVWTFSALTDSEGRFSLPVDPGRYRALVLPDPGSGLPRETRVLDVADSPAEVSFDLLPAALIAGQIRAGDTPVVGARVTAFSTFVGETGEPFELGAGISSDEGRFDIVLPDLDGEGGGL